MNFALLLNAQMQEVQCKTEIMAVELALFRFATCHCVPSLHLAILKAYAATDKLNSLLELH